MPLDQIIEYRIEKLKRLKRGQFFLPVVFGGYAIGKSLWDLVTGARHWGIPMTDNSDIIMMAVAGTSILATLITVNIIDGQIVLAEIELARSQDEIRRANG